MHLASLAFETMGTQPPFTPEGLERFVAAPRVGVLSYAKRDASVAQVPIWYRYRDGRFTMMSASTSPKVKALARSGRASLAIHDELPPYRGVVVEGEVKVVAAEDAALNSWLAMHYLGRVGGREFEKMTAERDRETGLSEIRFEPLRVRGFDNRRAIAKPLLAYMWLRDVLPVPRSWF